MILERVEINPIKNGIIITGVLYLVIFAFGFLLSRSGRPYNTVLLTVHKLASVAAIIYLYRSFSSVNKACGLNTITLAFGVLTGVIFIATIATGGLISIGGQIPEVVYMMHRVLPVLTVVSTAASLYLLNNISSGF